MAENETNEEQAQIAPADNNAVEVKVIARNEEILDPGLDLVSRVGRMASLCYRSETKEGEDVTARYERIIRQCIKSGHESVLEHGVMSVYFPVKEVHDSWKIMEKLTGQKGHRVDFRQVWERSRVEAQIHYLYPFMDPEIEARHNARENTVSKEDGYTNIMPVVVGNIRAWRLAIRQKLYLTTNLSHDPLAFAVTCVALKKLFEAAPIFFEDIVKELNNFREVQDQVPDKEPIKATIMSKINKETESVLDSIVDYCFDLPSDFYAEQAADCASLSVIYTTDRAFSHQHVRHRKDVAYSQESQRYVNYDKRGYEVVPPTIESSKKYAENRLISSYDLGSLNPESEWYKIWLKAMKNAFQSYHDLLEAHIDVASEGDEPEYELHLPPETCRGVLPNDTATRLGVTWILHDGYSNFNQLRIDKHAQYTIRSTAARVLVKALLMDHPFFNIIDPHLVLAWLSNIREQGIFENQIDTVDKASLRQKERMERIEREIAQERERQIAAMKNKEEEWKKEQAERKKILATGAAIKDMPAPEGGTNIVLGKPGDPGDPASVTERPPSVQFMEGEVPKALETGDKAQ